MVVKKQHRVGFWNKKLFDVVCIDIQFGWRMLYYIFYCVGDAMQMCFV